MNILTHIDNYFDNELKIVIRCEISKSFQICIYLIKFTKLSQKRTSKHNRGVWIPLTSIRFKETDTSK